MIKPLENYPRDQLNQIEIIIKDQEALNKKAETDKAVAAKALADKAVADKVAGDKAIADKVAADKAKADKVLADKLASDKAMADKAKADKALADKAAADKAKAEHTIAPTLGVNKYKEAISKADGYFKMKRYLEAKKSYEDALIAKANDSYAKDKLIEIEKILNSDAASINSVDAKIKELMAKYPLGVTEETISGSGVLIIQRVVVKEKTANVYQKKIFSWGGTTYLRDSNPITESIFEQETKP